jgi:hypothetical protein
MSINTYQARSCSGTSANFIFIMTNPTEYVHSVLVESLNISFTEVHNIKSYYSTALSVCMTVSLFDGAFPGPSHLEIEPE